MLDHVYSCCEIYVRRLLSVSSCDGVSPRVLDDLELLRKLLLADFHPSRAPDLSSLGDPVFLNISDHLSYIPNFINDSYLPKQANAEWIRVDDLSLPDSLSQVSVFDLLPQDLADLYADPANILLPPSSVQPVKPAFMISPQDYIVLCARLFRLGMLVYLLGKDVKAINGLFGVPKDELLQRLILDARPGNAHFSTPPSPGMVSPELLAALHLEKGVVFSVAKVDLKDYFHCLLLGPLYAPWLALPAVRAGDVGAPGFHPDVLVHPCFISLPMGWSHAVTIAQGVNVRLIDSTSAGGANRIQSAEDNRLDRRRSFVWVDDALFFSPSGDADNAVAVRQYMDAVASAGLRVNSKKCEPPSSGPMVGLGLLFDGNTSTVAVPAERLHRALRYTLRVLLLGVASGDVISRLVGRWSYACLVCRQAFAVFHAVYRFINVAGRRELILWPSVRKELMVICGLAPLLISTLSSRYYNRVTMSDSSEWGQGVVAANVSSSSAASISRLPQASSEVDFQRAVDDLPFCFQGLHWKLIVSSPWARAEHITTLELRAFKTSVMWMLSLSAAEGCRLVQFYDSMAVVGAVRKGRSSSRNFKPILRVLSAFVLATGCKLHILWVPTASNAADAPSRGVT